MKRHLILFLTTFLGGALIAFVARAALHQPHREVTAHDHVAPEHAPMVNNTLVPNAASASEAAPAGHVHPPAAPAAKPDAAHASHAAPSTAAVATSADVVNTQCAICGMPVDPALPTAEYQGKKIGFGCRMCPPKFKADPDKYGPYYLRNEVIKR